MDFFLRPLPSSDIFPPPRTNVHSTRRFTSALAWGSCATPPLLDQSGSLSQPAGPVLFIPPVLFKTKYYPFFFDYYTFSLVSFAVIPPVTLFWSASTSRQNDTTAGRWIWIRFFLIGPTAPRCPSCFPSCRRVFD